MTIRPRSRLHSSTASSSSSHRPSEARLISEADPPAPEGIAEVCTRVEPVSGLHLRPWHAADATVLADVWNDPVIARWNPVPPDASVAFAASWIEGTTHQNIASVGIDVVVADDEQSVLGEIGLQIDPERNIAEVGFWLHSRARGRGNGRPLLMLAQRLGAVLELVGLVAMIESGNDAASTLLDRSGWNEVPTTTQRRAFAHRVG